MERACLTLAEGAREREPRAHSWALATCGWPMPSTLHRTAIAKTASNRTTSIAATMALNGTPRDETARYLSQNFDLDDQDSLLDEVYARVGG